MGDEWRRCGRLLHPPEEVASKPALLQGVRARWWSLEGEEWRHRGRCILLSIAGKGKKERQLDGLAWVMLEVAIASLAGDIGLPLGSGVRPRALAGRFVDCGADVRVGRNPHAVADDGGVCGRRHLLEGVVEALFIAPFCAMGGTPDPACWFRQWRRYGVVLPP